MAGLAVPCLPFLVLAPSGFARTVFVSELVQSTHGRLGPRPRLADITGLTGLASLIRGSVAYASYLEVDAGVNQWSQNGHNLG